ncbi:MAG TPA: SEC-C metal-binding domain-containing protein [Armatimonadota bacterium]|nr:SEC-C metal-binding domain-containing protein [Armatimonadota bacterium]
MMGFVNWIFSGNEREIGKLRKVAEMINAFEPALEALSDEQLRGKTQEFRDRLANGETLDDLLTEAFAVVREAAKRVIGQRHFDVQMVGGIVLHQGRIAEMRTGEGKTLTATLPLYLNALEGKGAHLVTVNDYLGKFHAQWMGPIYDFLGLSVGALQGSNAETGEMEASYIFDREYTNEDEPVYPNLRRVDKREAYLADITYGTNHVYGFDYLRDNMAFSREELVQRELHYAIVDEVDSILIDEARTPLIISGQAEQSTDLYYRMDRVASRLVLETDYTIDEKARTAMLTDDGIGKVEQGIGVENLADDPELMHHANAALKARTIFKKDIDYVVKGDGAERQVIIVDEFTGRLMFGRRYGDGLHQAIEAKEGIKPEAESQTLATITYQNYFRLYDKLSGMTGTAKTEEEEFRKIYGLDVVIIPTNKPMIRADNPDVIYKSEEAKLRGITLEILRLHSRQQPILVGTRSIDMSERVGERLHPDRLQLLAATFVFRSMLEDTKSIEGDTRKGYQQLLNAKFGDLTLGRLVPIGRAVGASMDMLTDDNVNRLASIMEVQDSTEIKRLRDCLAEGIPHSILNAKLHEKEAEIIADAGRQGVVTIATNMAGRGVDIILGGKQEGSSRNFEANEVVGAGGLFIVGSERHESRRIDNQLRGRAGRQGDPGASRFFVSLEDELWRVFGDKSQSPWLASWTEDMAMPSKLLSRMIERTQKKMEYHYFEMRKHVLQYDDVMNVQREVIYGQRRKILEGVDLKPTILEYLDKSVSEGIDMYCSEQMHPSEWDTGTLFEMMDEVFPLSIYAKPDDLKGKKRAELEEFLGAVLDRTYEDREKELGAELMRDLERHIALRAINNKWMEHLDAMDYLREGIGLRGYAQIDPLVAYKKEGYDMFQETMHNVQEEIVRLIYRVQVRVDNEPYRNPYRNVQMTSAELAPPPEFGDEMGEDRLLPGPPMPVTAHQRNKVGRNDPCPCGSGKKYKKCCLLNE